MLLTAAALAKAAIEGAVAIATQETNPGAWQAFFCQYPKFWEWISGSLGSDGKWSFEVC
jgi:hypothetical protein